MAKVAKKKIKEMGVKKENVVVAITISLLLVVVVFLLNSNITGLAVLGEGVLKANPNFNFNIGELVFNNFGILLILLILIVFLIAVNIKKKTNEKQSFSRSRKL